MDEKPVKCGCSGESRIYSWNEEDDGVQSIHYHAICMKCGIETNAYDTEAEAITAWNKAMGERTAKATRKPEAFFYRCECGYGLCCEKNDMNYCPSCGARLEWK